MRPPVSSRFCHSSVATALLALTSACTVVDVHPSDERAEVHSHGLIEGFASVGFAEDPSLLKVEVFDGRSDGAIFLLDAWHLFRVEVGLLGAALGVGPFDVGVGTLFYEPRSPARPWAWDGDEGEAETEDARAAPDPDDSAK